MNRIAQGLTPLLKIKGEKRKVLKKHITSILALLSLLSLAIMPTNTFVSLASPPSNPDELIVDRPTGEGPVTVDPAKCCDMVSAELIFNVYETLVFFDGERYDVFMPQLATQVWVGPPQDNPAYGPVSPPYTNFTIYFKIRTGVPFHNRSRTDEPQSWNNYYLSTADVEYSFERLMVHDYVGGPASMIFESLLDTYGADPTDPTFGDKINYTIQSNATYVWLNIANPDLTTATPTSFAPVAMFEVEDGRFNATFWDQTSVLPIAYRPRILFQVVSQPWTSILSKDWILNHVIPNGPDMNPGVPGDQVDWDGDFSQWTDYTGWSESPLDKIPIGGTHPATMCGTGPYILDVYDPSVGGSWSAVKSDAYWRGWPAQWPSPPYSPYPSSGIKPAGYVTRLTVRQNTTAQRTADMLAGDCDLADIPHIRASGLHEGGDRNGPTKTGIRLNYPICTLKVQSLHYTFYIEPTLENLYGTIYDNDTLAEEGIPANFFSDTNVRKAFAYLINFTMVIQDQLLGEAYQPHTCAPDGMPYVNLSQTRYGPQPDFPAAKAEFDQAFGGNLASSGFSVTITYNAGDAVEEAMCENLAAMINYLGNTYYGGIFHSQALGVEWPTYIQAMEAHQLPVFSAYWLGDYVDMQDFMFTYMHSQGFFGTAQRYSDTYVDDLLKDAIRASDGPARQAIYYELEAIYYKDVPSVPVFVAVERGYMRDWVQGHYYNPLYPDIYAYNHWKAEEIQGDVNYDGVVNTMDICAIQMAFGAYAGKQGMPVFHGRWNFHCDIDDNPRYRWRDRKIDMYEANVWAEKFGQGIEPPPLHGGHVYLVAKPSKEIVGIGCDVNVTVEVQNASDITCYEVQLFYNTTLLELVNWYTGPLPDGWSVSGPPVLRGDKLWITNFAASYEASPINGNVTLVTLTFRGLAVGTSPLNISTSTFAAGWSVQPTPYNPINSEVTVTITGDVDENHMVSLNDITLSLDGFGSTIGPDGWYRHMKPCIYCPHSPSIDIDGDGKIALNDITVVLDHFGEEYP